MTGDTVVDRQKSLEQAGGLASELRRADEPTCLGEVVATADLPPHAVSSRLIQGALKIVRSSVSRSLAGTSSQRA